MRDQIFAMPSGPLGNSKGDVSTVGSFTALAFWFWVLNLGKAVLKSVVRGAIISASVIDALRQEAASGNI